MKRLAINALGFGAMLILLGLLALPFYWMILTALRPEDATLEYPPSWLPTHFRWENFAEAWQAAPFGRFYLNSLIAGAGGAALQVGLALLMAYAFAFIRFPGKHVLLILVIATMLIPDEMKLIPNYLLLRRLGWIDTYWALILPPAAHAFPVFVLYQQFRSVPAALLEAARIDGASHHQSLRHIAAPLSRPVLAAVALMAFLGRWNDYLWPLVVTNSLRMRTLPIGLAYFQQTQDTSAQWNLLMAASIWVMIPLIALYALTQRQFVDGIMRGALKA